MPAQRRFAATITILVHNEEVDSHQAMNFTLDELADHLTDRIRLDIDQESDLLTLGKDEENQIVSAEINWDELKEISQY